MSSVQDVDFWDEACLEAVDHFPVTIRISSFQAYKQDILGNITSEMEP